MLFGLGNNNKKKNICTCSVQITIVIRIGNYINYKYRKYTFIPCIFNLWLAESVDVELANMGGRLYIYTHFQNTTPGSILFFTHVIIFGENI